MLKNFSLFGKSDSEISAMFAAVLLIFCGGFFLEVSAQNDSKIEEIRKIYKETNEKIAQSDADGESSDTYLIELAVNKNNGSYPAVGIYRTVAKFYYTYGDREKNPYPNRLLKAEIATDRSARTENSEFLFNSSGQLIFYFENKDDTEMRVYFSAEKPVKILKGTQNININDKEANEKIKNILAEKRKLVGIFSNSLDW